MKKSELREEVKILEHKCAMLKRQLAEHTKVIDAVNVENLALRQERGELRRINDNVSHMAEEQRKDIVWLRQKLVEYTGDNKWLNPPNTPSFMGTPNEEH